MFGPSVNNWQRGVKDMVQRIGSGAVSPIQAPSRERGLENDKVREQEHWEKEEKQEAGASPAMHKAPREKERADRGKGQGQGQESRAET